MKEKLIHSLLKIDPAHLNAYSSGLLQGKAYRILNMHLTEALLPFGLTIPEWKLLGQLYDHGDMRLAEIAERLNVEAPIVTLLIDTLEKKMFVTKTNDKNDRRVKNITATAKGTKIIPDIEKVVKTTMAELLTGVSRSDLLGYIRVLEAIVDNG